MICRSPALLTTSTWRRCTEDLSLGTNVTPAEAGLMGCLTIRADVAGRVAQAGIRVWFMYQSYELVGSCRIIMNVVELTTPTDFSTENRPASTNLYEGLPGINQLLAIYTQGHVCTDVEEIPLLQNYALTPSDNTPSPTTKIPPQIVRTPQKEAPLDGTDKRQRELYLVSTVSRYTREKRFINHL